MNCASRVDGLTPFCETSLLSAARLESFDADAAVAGEE